MRSAPITLETLDEKIRREEHLSLLEDMPPYHAVKLLSEMDFQKIIKLDNTGNILADLILKKIELLTSCILTMSMRFAYYYEYEEEPKKNPYESFFTFFEQFISLHINRYKELLEKIIPSRIGNLRALKKSCLTQLSKMSPNRRKIYLLFKDVKNISEEEKITFLKTLLMCTRFLCIPENLIKFLEFTEILNVLKDNPQAQDFLRVIRHTLTEFQRSLPTEAKSELSEDDGGKPLGMTYCRLRDFLDEKRLELERETSMRAVAQIEDELKEEEAKKQRCKEQAQAKKLAEKRVAQTLKEKIRDENRRAIRHYRDTFLKKSFLQWKKQVKFEQVYKHELAISRLDLKKAIPCLLGRENFNLLVRHTVEQGYLNLLSAARLLPVFLSSLMIRSTMPSSEIFSIEENTCYAEGEHLAALFNKVLKKIQGSNTPEKRWVLFRLNWVYLSNTNRKDFFSLSRTERLTVVANGFQIFSERFYGNNPSLSFDSKDLEEIDDFLYEAAKKQKEASESLEPKKKKKSRRKKREGVPKEEKLEEAVEMREGVKTKEEKSAENEAFEFFYSTMLEKARELKLFLEEKLEHTVPVKLFGSAEQRKQLSELMKAGIIPERHIEFMPSDVDLRIEITKEEAEIIFQTLKEKYGEDNVVNFDLKTQYFYHFHLITESATLDITCIFHGYHETELSSLTDVCKAIGSTSAEDKTEHGKTFESSFTHHAEIFLNPNKTSLRDYLRLYKTYQRFLPYMQQIDDQDIGKFYLTLEYQLVSLMHLDSFVFSSQLEACLKYTELSLLAESGIFSAVLMRILCPCPDKDSLQEKSLLEKYLSEGIKLASLLKSSGIINIINEETSIEKRWLLFRLSMAYLLASQTKKFNTKLIGEQFTLVNQYYEHPIFFEALQLLTASGIEITAEDFAQIKSLLGEIPRIENLKVLNLKDMNESSQLLYSSLWSHDTSKEALRVGFFAEKMKEATAHTFHLMQWLSPVRQFSYLAQLTAEDFRDRIKLYITQNYLKYLYETKILSIILIRILYSEIVEKDHATVIKIFKSIYEKKESGDEEKESVDEEESSHDEESILEEDSLSEEWENQLKFYCKSSLLLADEFAPQTKTAQLIYNASSTEKRLSLFWLTIAYLLTAKTKDFFTRTAKKQRTAVTITYGNLKEKFKLSDITNPHEILISIHACLKDSTCLRIEEETRVTASPRMFH